MALYFSREAGHVPPSAESPKTKAPARRLVSSFLALTLILILAVAEACGFFRNTEVHLLQQTGLIGLLGSSPPRSRPLLLLKIDSSTTEGNTDPMDLALALRGLALLRPSLIVMAVSDPTRDHRVDFSTQSDSFQLLQSVKARIHEAGIPLVEGIPPSPDTLYRPIPLCRYLPPGVKTVLPYVAGKVASEGTSRYLPEPQGAATIPLLASASDNGVAGSLWWDPLIEGQPNAPVWLLANRYLLLPNHTPLPCPDGVLPRSPEPDSLHTIALEDFLLRIEEKERGTLRPGFEDLWQGAIVVIAPGSMEASVRTLATIRKITAWGAVPLTWQFVSLLLLMIFTGLALHFRGRPASIIAILLGLALAACIAWCLIHGILPGIFPSLASVICSLICALASQQVSKDFSLN